MPLHLRSAPSLAHTVTQPLTAHLGRYALAVKVCAAEPARICTCWSAWSAVFPTLCLGQPQSHGPTCDPFALYQPGPCGTEFSVGEQDGAAVRLDLKPTLRGGKDAPRGPVAGERA